MLPKRARSLAQWIAEKSSDAADYTWRDSTDEAYSGLGLRSFLVDNLPIHPIRNAQDLEQTLYQSFRHPLSGYGRESTNPLGGTPIFGAAFPFKPRPIVKPTKVIDFKVAKPKRSNAEVREDYLRARSRIEVGKPMPVTQARSLQLALHLEKTGRLAATHREPEANKSLPPALKIAPYKVPRYRTGGR